MGRRIDITQLGWELFALLAFCALAVRAVVPAGYMPTVSADGVVMTLCTGSGAIEALVSFDDEDGNHAPADTPCAFTVSLGTLLVVALAVFAARIVSVSAHGRAIADLTVHRLAAPPPPALGPPARV